MFAQKLFLDGFLKNTKINNNKINSNLDVSMLFKNKRHLILIVVIITTKKKLNKIM